MTVMMRVGYAGLLAGLMLMHAAPAASQGFGVKAGVTFSTVAVDPSDALGLDVTGKAGLVAGGYVTFREEARLSLQVDAQATLRRVAFGDDIEDRMTYVEFPVLARYVVLRRESLVVRALGGVSINYLLKAEESVLGEDASDIKDAIKPFETAVVVGAHAEWNGRWTFDGRYVLGLSEVYEVVIGGIATRQRGFQITAGYRFR